MKYVVIALIAFGLVGAFVAYLAGHKAGAAEIQVKWDADRALIAQQSAAALAAVTAEKEKALADNATIEDQYLAAVADASRRIDALTASLRDYQNTAARSSPLPAAPGRSDPAATAAPDGGESLTRALAARLVECDDNEAQLSALIAEITPQLAAQERP
jgi:hypothetical protein